MLKRCVLQYFIKHQKTIFFCTKKKQTKKNSLMICILILHEQPRENISTELYNTRAPFSVHPVVSGNFIQRVFFLLFLKKGNRGKFGKIRMVIRCFPSARRNSALGGCNFAKTLRPRSRSLANLSGSKDRRRIRSTEWAHVKTAQKDFPMSPEIH